ncbi:hypothetical protein ACO0SA_002456 [Hanseniaspora valbyensis]
MSTLTFEQSVSSRRVNAQNLRKYMGVSEPVKVFGRIDLQKNLKIEQLLNSALQDPSQLDDVDGFDRWEINIDSPISLKNSNTGNYSEESLEESDNNKNEKENIGAEWIVMTRCKIAQNMLYPLVSDIIEYLKRDTEHDKRFFYFEFLITVQDNGDMSFIINDYYLAPFINDTPNIKAVLALCKLSEDDSKFLNVFYRNDI